jgi:hypothetical protein
MGGISAGSNGSVEKHTPSAAKAAIVLRHFGAAEEAAEKASSAPPSHLGG